LEKIINSAISTIQIPSNITIQVPETDIELKCDAEKIEIVLINIILNAVQEIGEDRGKIEISASLENEFCFITIKNTGKPIPEELFKKIFEPLFTTKIRGTGLGLATCKNVIEQHGGSIYVKNNPTTFIIKIPIFFKEVNRER
jgi:signal transduction histidine kinase